jgi:hypothetical protein
LEVPSVTRVHPEQPANGNFKRASSSYGMQEVGGSSPVAPVLSTSSLLLGTAFVVYGTVTAGREARRERGGRPYGDDAGVVDP